MIQFNYNYPLFLLLLVIILGLEGIFKIFNGITHTVKLEQDRYGIVSILDGLVILAIVLLPVVF